MKVNRGCVLAVARIILWIITLVLAILFVRWVWSWDLPEWFRIFLMSF